MLHKIFKSFNGNNYLYDANTNYILKIDSIAKEILENLGDKIVEINSINDFRNISNNFFRSYDRSTTEMTINNIISLKKKYNMFTINHFDKVIFPFNKEDYFKEIKTNLNTFDLHITNDCNFRCSYCVFDKYYPTVKNHSKKSMNKEMLDKILSFIEKHSIHTSEIHVGFYGGNHY